MAVCARLVRSGGHNAGELFEWTVAAISADGSGW